MRKLEALEENEFNMICDSLNGVVMDLKPLSWRINITENVIKAGNVLKLKWEVDIDILEYKLDCMPNIEFLELLTRVDLFWQKNESYYESFNIISPKAKILEITGEVAKHEPIIWHPKMGSPLDFYMVALGLNLEYIIYVQDSEGNDKSIWATSGADLLECMFTISESFYFGSLDSLYNSLKKDGWLCFNDQI
jgi:hypothetical protein